MREKWEEFKWWVLFITHNHPRHWGKPFRK